MKRMFFFLVVANVLYACGSNPSEKKEEPGAHDTTKAADEIRSNMSFLNDYNAIEGVFGNDNWMKIDNKDTTFYYFSRHSSDFNTYQYKLVKGDSANVVYGKIQPVQNQLAWIFDGKKLLVTSATIARIAATAEGDTAARYEFSKLDNNHIRVTYPSQKQLVMQKTIAFGLFLVRSRYDYANGTRLAFDTTEFKRKGK